MATKALKATRQVIVAITETHGDYPLQLASWQISGQSTIDATKSSVQDLEAQVDKAARSALKSYRSERSRTKRRHGLSSVLL